MQKMANRASAQQGVTMIGKQISLFNESMEASKEIESLEEITQNTERNELEGQISLFEYLEEENS